MKTVMGIDLGTQGVKVIVYGPREKSILKESYAPIDIISDSAGRREQMAEWWITAFEKCIDEIEPGLMATIAAIGVSGQQHGFVPVAEDGTVLAPVKLWCDTATQDECTEIMDVVGGPEACVAHAGNPIAVGYTASKILWLKKNLPDAYNAMSTIMLPHDYMNFYLTGERVMECGDASGTGLLDVRDRKWSLPMVQAVDPDRDLMSCLPKLVESHLPIGTISKEIATKYGFRHDCIVSTGGGDNMMAAIGTGNVTAGALTASLGTSGTLFGYADEPIIDDSGDLAAFCSSNGGWLPLLCTMNCTVSTEQMRALLNKDVDEMETLASSIPIGSDGVITLPFYNGERTPALPNGKAIIAGLDLENTTRSHLLRSAMEAAIFGLKVGLQAFERGGMHFDKVTLTGGGSNSPLWRQITADVLNLPVQVLERSENAAFGAALQAHWCRMLHKGETFTLQELADEHLIVDAKKSATPNVEAVAAYEKVFEKYQAYVTALTPLYA